MTANAAAALSSKSENVTFLFRVPLVLAGLVLLLGFVVMAYLAATTSYVPFDVPFALWLQGQLGGVTSWFGVITDLNGTRQTLAGILVLVLVVIVNPRTILFVFLASLTGPLYSVVNALVMRPRPGAHLVRVRSTWAAAPSRAGTPHSRPPTRRCWFFAWAAGTCTALASSWPRPPARWS
jgi:hypothetical protein